MVFARAEYTSHMYTARTLTPRDCSMQQSLRVCFFFKKFFLNHTAIGQATLGWMCYTHDSKIGKGVRREGGRAKIHSWSKPHASFFLSFFLTSSLEFIIPEKNTTAVHRAKYPWFNENMKAI